ncbi:MAG: SRPBCC domain-containing protein [Ignavibacteriales bacterium]|nr:SRPBCC domain-containing protein [Ignavibacteriales bacterium]
MPTISELIPAQPENTIETIRVIPKDIDLAFSAWTDSGILQQWWGPHGFTNTFAEHDLCPGGRWTFTMHGPNGQNYLNECVFIEVEKPVFVAWHHHSAPYFQGVVTFQKEEEGITKITYRMIFKSVELCAQLRDFIVEKNEENFDRLEAVLAGL